uniref:Uncharacterized protein n=1 Tax=Arundo donax TaxID=35708 RepID=A0A0A8ZC80_ARUDO
MTSTHSLTNQNSQPLKLINHVLVFNNLASKNSHVI